MTPENRSIYTELYQAVEGENLRQFKQIFDEQISGNQAIINDIGINFSDILRAAVDKRQLDILNEFVVRLPSMIPDMLASKSYAIFWGPCRVGELDMFNRLVELLEPQQVQDMIASWDYHLFATAAASGNIKLLERIIELAPDKVQIMIAADNFSAFRQAAGRGHLHILTKLETIAPEKIPNMLKAQSYSSHDGPNAYAMAASSGHLAIMKHLEEIAPPQVQVQDMISSYNYDAFTAAAFHAHPEIVEHLINTVDAEHLQNMLSQYINSGRLTQNIQENYNVEAALVLEKIMRVASTENRDAIFQRFLEYRSIIPPESHIRQYLERLRPDLVSIASMIQHAILFGKIVTIRQLAHDFPDQFQQAIQADNYELFKMAALRAGNSENHLTVAIHLLEQMPEAERQSMINAFITRPFAQIIVENQDELTAILLRSIVNLASEANRERIWQESVSISGRLLPGSTLSMVQTFATSLFPDRPLPVIPEPTPTALGLNERAQNRESSMQRLTPGEEKRLLAAKLHYQVQLQAEGSATIIENFKQDLKRRYEQNPAKVRTGDGREIELPFEWADAARLMTTLSADTREAALKAYYQHPTHTAYRYFLKPNPWMDRGANFVYRDALGNGWSSFENHQDLIALLIVAANDENIPEIEGFNQESRVSELIQEIALINRAHNWDESRLNPVTQQHEEYDNQKPDCPSCSPGVTSRLFQAVKKHPLLELLTPEMINEEIRPFIKAHFEEAINATNCRELQQAWEKVIGGDAPPEVLKSLNIPEDKQQLLIESIAARLRDKYGSQFDDDPSLLAHLKQAFQIKSPFNSLAEKFGGKIDLEGILEEKVKATPLSQADIRACRLKFFQQSKAPDTQDPNPKGPKGPKG